MGEYEPDDSRIVTQSTHRAPGEPPRTGPREAETREGQTRQSEAQQGETELEQDERGEDPEQTVSAEDQQLAQEQRRGLGYGASGEQGLDEAPDATIDRND